MTAAKKNLIGLGRDELVAEMEKIGEKPFRAAQLWHWLYHRGVAEFAAMTSLGKALRQKLEDGYTAARPRIVEDRLSKDKSRKWLLAGPDGAEFETVFIPEKDRGALCLSSQVGCTLTCGFCRTGTQRLVRNLGAGEIIGQMMVAKDAYGEWPSPVDGRLLSNIVMMGMGEPLYNFDAVAAALRIAMDPEGLAISRRRITLSTAGVVPMIGRVGAELGVGLAVSLHAVTDELRDTLVPLNRKYPIAELLAACRDYPGSKNSRRITFEYVMLKGVNSSPADARALAKLLAPIHAKINLIPFNAWPGAPFECATPAAIRRFSQILNDAGYSAPIRKPRGRDILAACGQLKSASVKARKGEAAAKATA